MLLKTEKLEVTLRPTTRKIIKITETYKSKNLNELYFKAMKDSDIKTLAIIIFELSEDENEKKAFNGDINRVYDFIDDWKKEMERTYLDLFKDIATMVNDEGFFLKKMTEKELQEMIDNPLVNFDLEAIIKSSAEKAVADIATNEFKGYKA